MTQAAPGWYPDPGAPPGVAPHVRYWDGADWTHHVQPVQSAQPVQPAQPPQQWQPGQQPAAAGPTTPDGERLSGWWWRVLASFLDGIFLGIASTIVTLPVQIDIQRETNDITERYLNDPASPDFAGFWEATSEVYRDHIVGMLIAPVILAFAYHGGFLRWKGATPGKMICGLRVRLRERPGRLPWSAIAIRLTVQSVVPSAFLVMALVSGSIALLALGYVFFLGFWALDGLWAAWSKKRQAIHDIAARTNVVRPR